MHGEQFQRVAEVVGHIVPVVTDGVEVQVEGYREEAGQGVRYGHGDEEQIGGIPHGFFHEDHADERVGDHGQQDHDGGHYAKQWNLVVINMIITIINNSYHDYYN